jgi:hypothetical protein
LEAKPRYVVLSALLTMIKATGLPTVRNIRNITSSSSPQADLGIKKQHALFTEPDQMKDPLLVPGL